MAGLPFTDNPTHPRTQYAVMESAKSGSKVRLVQLPLNAVIPLYGPSPTCTTISAIAHRDLSIGEIVELHA